MRVDQFHSGAGPGDAITNGLFYIQRLLREAGVEGEIYAEHIDPRLEGRILSLKQLRPREDACLLWQHSMGHDSLARLLALPQRKALIYQNITPPSFFSNNKFLAQYAQIGLDQIKPIADNCRVLTAPSAFNAEDIQSRVDRPVVSLPLLVDIASVVRRRARFTRMEDMNGAFNVLTVARLMPHKGHLKILEIALRLQALLKERRLRWWIVGGWSDADGVHATLVRRIEELGLQETVRVTGMVPDEELTAFYRACDALVLPSEHEGFSVPIVEAFAFDLPVFANGIGAMPETLNGGGVIVDTRESEAVAHELARLALDRGRRREIIMGQRKARLRYDPPVVYEAMRNALAPIVSLPDHRFESAFADEAPFEVRGPFFGSYSLAIVNRNVVAGLDDATGFETALFLTEGPGDIPPSESDATAHPKLAQRLEAQSIANVPRTTIDLMWPPRPQDARGLYVTPYFFWEESLVPPDIVTNFNTHADAVLCSSRFTAKALRDSGYRGPAPVVGSAVDEEWRAKLEVAGIAPRVAEMIPTNLIVLLHVSSGFPRKGIDTLMRAYRESFDQSTEVMLLIKSIPSPHQEVDRLWTVLNYGAPNAPRFVNCTDDLSTDEMIWLQKRADAIVTMTKGEGFCIPVAEAMILGKPLVFPRHSSLLDFPKYGNEVPVEWQFSQSKSHIAQSGSLWCDVDVSSAATALKSAVKHANTNRARRLRPTKSVIPSLANAEDIARNIVAASEHIANRSSEKTSGALKLAWLSSFGKRCGIADYSAELLCCAEREGIDALVLSSEITASAATLPVKAKHVWNDGSPEGLDRAFDELVAFGAKAVVIQFNFGFYSLPKLEEFSRRVKTAGLPLVIEMHAVELAGEDTPGATLASFMELWGLADRVLVHSISDMNLLAGFIDPLKLTLFPHASFGGMLRNKDEVRRHLDLLEFNPIIATCGFFLPGKGLDTAVAILEEVLKKRPDTLLLMVNSEYPNPLSRAEIERVEAIICARGLENHVIMMTEYLPLEDCQTLLQAADAIILPYAPSKESASGSVRRAIAAGRPVIASRQSIFGDLQDIIALADQSRPEQFAQEVLRVLEDPRRSLEILSRQENWMAVHAPQALAKRLFGMIAGLAVDAELGNGVVSNGFADARTTRAAISLARKANPDRSRQLAKRKGQGAAE